LDRLDPEIDVLGDLLLRRADRPSAAVRGYRLTIFIPEYGGAAIDIQDWAVS
jgi:hypothetical protein